MSTNTNFATVAAILYAGGKPFYLDMDEKYFAPKQLFKDPIKAPKNQAIIWLLKNLFNKKITIDISIPPNK